jgi:hypothetical protein
VRSGASGYGSVMSYRLSRALSVATAAYGGYALTQPEHLWQAMQSDRKHQEGLELLARTYGVRDLAISSLAIFGRSPRTVQAAMLLRIAMDLGDAALLSVKAKDDEIRRKVLAVTIGWAGLNAAALAIDHRRAR